MPCDYRGEVRVPGYTHENGLRGIVTHLQEYLSDIAKINRDHPRSRPSICSYLLPCLTGGPGRTQARVRTKKKPTGNFPNRQISSGLESPGSTRSGERRRFDAVGATPRSPASPQVSRFCSLPPGVVPHAPAPTPCDHELAGTFPLASRLL